MVVLLPSSLVCYVYVYFNGVMLCSDENKQAISFKSVRPSLLVEIPLIISVMGGINICYFFQAPILYIRAQFKGTFRLTMKRKLIQMQCHLEGFQTILGAEHCPIKYLRANFHAGANQLQ